MQILMNGDHLRELQCYWVGLLEVDINSLGFLLFAHFKSLDTMALLRQLESKS